MPWHVHTNGRRKNRAFSSKPFDCMKDPDKSSTGPVTSTGEHAGTWQEPGSGDCEIAQKAGEGIWLS